jgi:hypothetical protein
VNDPNQISLADLRRFIGRLETVTDLVAASSIVKLTATPGVENPAKVAGGPIPSG